MVPAEQIRDEPTKRSWFGVAGAAVAWSSLGVADVLITWRACLKSDPTGGSLADHPAALVLYIVMACAVVAVAAAAGTMSYRKWRRLSESSTLLRAEGNERREFMALSGIFISFTLGAGIVWLCLPLFIIQMCTRAR